jgi:hypothetical protein
MKREDRRKASTDARVELRKQAVKLRAAGKTLAEISEITGYKVPYLSTMLRALKAKPEQTTVVRRGGRPKASGRADVAAGAADSGLGVSTVPGSAATAVCAVDAQSDSDADRREM